jgi:tripeptidyl-peptidase-1
MYHYSLPDNIVDLKPFSNLCNAYMQLGALGTSLIFSSGDGGVSGSQSQTWSV